MQSTGHGATHSSHPVHQRSTTVCMRFAAPMIASTGQAWMHSVQPMHHASSMTATRRGSSRPQAGSSPRAARPVSAARRRSVNSPPGGQRSMGAPCSAMARA